MSTERRRTSARSPSLFARQAAHGRRLRPGRGATEHASEERASDARDGAGPSTSRPSSPRTTKPNAGDERGARRSRARANAPAHEAVSEAFRRLACAASNKFGSPLAFIVAVALIVGWGATGPLFHFSNTWQLVINTGTTIVTFLMVFLIQSTQNRDAHAIHLKLDELIRSSKARDVFADLEDASDEELQRFQEEFEQLRKRVAAVAAKKRRPRQR
jgi:low affinity Fe/Cu permease